MTALTQQQFLELTEDIPEDAFRNLIPLIMESFANKRGRKLDTTQIAALAVGFSEMAATIDTQVSYIGELQAEIEELKDELKKRKSKIWTPQA